MLNVGDIKRKAYVSWVMEYNPIDEDGNEVREPYQLTAWCQIDFMGTIKKTEYCKRTAKEEEFIDWMRNRTIDD